MIIRDYKLDVGRYKWNTMEHIEFFKYADKYVFFTHTEVALYAQLFGLIPLFCLSNSGSFIRLSI